MLDRPKRRRGLILAAFAIIAMAPPGVAQAPSLPTVKAPDPLFAAADTIRITIRGPLNAIARNAARSTEPHDASLALAAGAETHPIKLSARGISRRKSETCPFPPLRIEFMQKPAAASLFKGQKRLKLVTHCRPPQGFQRYLLLEYAAYRLFNVLTPLSPRVRIALIDYVEAGTGKPIVSRLGFLIEDTDDAARRNGLAEAATGDRIRVAQLSAREAARVAVFQYMIGNLDWAMIAGPAGAGCCHNMKLAGTAKGATAGLVPIPYDFDASGLVDAPYAAPPEEISVPSVRTRRYRGYCAHNEQAQAAAAEARAARPALQSALAEVPQLDRAARRRAESYLAGFFDDIGSPERVAEKLLRTCLRG